MSTLSPLCRELSLGVKAMLDDLPVTTRKRVAFLVLGILLSGSVVQRLIGSKLRSYIGGSTSAESHERRLRRVLSDKSVSWEEVYAPTLKQVLKWQRAKRLTVLMDESGHSEVFRVLTAALWYRGRAIPLGWLSWEAQQPLQRSYWEYVRDLLAMVESVLPKGPRVLIIADRAYGHPAFIDLVTPRGWDWLVRVQRQTCYRDARGKRTQLSRFLTKPGQRWRGRGWLFRKAGWRECSCVAYWSRSHREPLLLASSLAAEWDLIALYRLRGAIETLFRDWKSAGWHWEASQLRSPAQHDRLLVGMAWATLVVLCLGNQLANSLLTATPRPRRTLPWHAKHSLFRLGLDQLDARLFDTDQTPLLWELADFDAPAWQRQVRERQTQAIVWSPTLPKAA